MKVLSKILIFTFLIIGLFSCKYKPLCYDDCDSSFVEIVFDWKYAPNADVESMTVLFYNTDGAKRLEMQLPGNKISVVQVPQGDYKVVCFSNERNSRRWNFENKDIWDEFNLSSITAPNGNYSLFRSRSLELESIDELDYNVIKDTNPNFYNKILAFGELYTDKIELVTIEPIRKIKQRIVLYPKNRVAKYNVIIRDAKNQETASNFTATIPGIAGAYSPTLEKLIGEPNLIEFYPRLSQDKTQITSHFYTLGPIDINTKERFNLYIFCRLADGRSWYGNVDITDRLKEAILQDPFNVTITIDNFEFPYVIATNNDGGLDPNVVDFENEDIIINI